MIIRKAEIKDIPFLNKLLVEVCALHSEGRPDLFRKNAKKYTDNELISLLNLENEYIFVAEIDREVVGYCFCERHSRGPSGEA